MSGIVGRNLGRGSGLVKSTAVAADAVDSANIADDAIDSEHYTDGSIDNAHIADNAIDSEHYADGSIDNAHIADDAIDSEHYAAGSIDNAHLADDAVDSDELAAGAVDTAHIADNQVTLAKMDGLARGKLIYGDSSGDPAALAVGSADQVLTHDGTDLSWEDASGGADTTHLAVGTYHNLFNTSAGLWFPGETQAGSALFYRADTQSNNTFYLNSASGYTAATGTWRHMSQNQNKCMSSLYATTLCVRTA